MNGLSFGTVPKPEDSNGNENWLSIVKGFEREELEELLAQSFCGQCEIALRNRVQSIADKRNRKLSISGADSSQSDDIHRCSESSITESQTCHAEKSESNESPQSNHTRSWASYADKFSPASVNSNRLTQSNGSKSGRLVDDETCKFSSVDEELQTEEHKEKLRFAKIGRKKDFKLIERVNGKSINVLQGLELHTGVFNDEEQKQIVKSVYEFQRMGQKRRLRERTYSEPSKWMRGKGRVTIQFGCCYNYAVDKNGNPPGIIRDEDVDPLPPIFLQMIKRLVRWHVLPPTCVPNSCIVNIYDEGDCIPPHIDHHDFVRPFCTISFLTECNILFGSNLKIVGPGEFSGPFSIPLPVGSVLVLKGNGADVAKHCVPAVPAKRISITFRKMDESKIPYGFSPDPELQNLRPLALTPPEPLSQQTQTKPKQSSPPAPARVPSKPSVTSLFNGEDDFPPLGSMSASRQKRS